MPLTLHVVEIGINTFLALQVNNLIDQFGEDRASVILVITDGRLLDLKAAANQVC